MDAPRRGEVRHCVEKLSLVAMPWIKFRKHQTTVKAPFYVNLHLRLLFRSLCSVRSTLISRYLNRAYYRLGGKEWRLFSCRR